MLVKKKFYVFQNAVLVLFVFPPLCVSVGVDGVKLSW